MRVSTLLRVFLLGITVFSLGCSAMARSAFSPPAITLRDVKLSGINIGGGTLDVLLNVHNRNGYRLDARRLTYRVLMDSTLLGSGVVDSAMTVHAGDSVVVKLPVQFTFAGLGAAARRLQMSGALDYRVVGELVMTTPVGALTQPYDQRGTFSLMDKLRQRFAHKVVFLPQRSRRSQSVHSVTSVVEKTTLQAKLFR